ncbi:MAG: glycoside hydrolase family 9 protein [Bacteroidota bacterium]
MLLVLALVGCRQEPVNPFIAVNLVGYNQSDTKQAYFVNANVQDFEIVNTKNDNMTYRGSVSVYHQPDQITGDSIAVADFSNFTSSGQYIIRTRDPVLESSPFFIGRDMYLESTLTAVQSFYYNRCGIAIQNGSSWAHPACHQDDAVFYADPEKHKEVVGGWHDAGDYGKFSINTAYTIGLLMELYEVHPQKFYDNQLDIPEAGNGVPDLLDEIQWGLTWLLKMQRPDGGVYHKVSQKVWKGEVPPHLDQERRYLFKVSSNATAAFAAVAARGIQLFSYYDPEFAHQLRDAAEQAWEYLEYYPVTQPLGGFQNPPDVQGGEYGDHLDTDERMWAAIELYKSTGDQKYISEFVKLFRLLDPWKLPPLSWKDTHMLAWVSFLNAEIPDAYTRYQDKLLKQAEHQAARLMRQRRHTNYNTLLRSSEYYWGSASVNLGYAYLLINMHELTGQRNYYEAALDQLHYTLGRNPFGQSLVTGIGSNPVQHPYHQFSMTSDVEQPVPGMMVGGPNDYLLWEDRQISPFPGKSYEDHEMNYLVNEVAINYTAIFAYVAGYFSTTENLISTLESP